MDFQPLDVHCSMNAVYDVEITWMRRGCGERDLSGSGLIDGGFLVLGT